MKSLWIAMKIQISKWESQSELSNGQKNPYNTDHVINMISAFSKINPKWFSNVEYTFEDTAKLAILIDNELRYLKQLTSHQFEQLGFSQDELIEKTVEMYNMLWEENVDFEVMQNNIDEFFIRNSSGKTITYQTRARPIAKFDLNYIESMEARLEYSKPNSHIKLFIFVPLMETGIIQRQNFYKESKICTYLDWTQQRGKRQKRIRNHEFSFNTVWNE